jgi:hypothetical protein
MIVNFTTAARLDFAVRCDGAMGSRKRKRKMVELVLLACLLKSPSHCESHYLPMMVDTSMTGCLFTGQFQVVHWIEDHPDWVVRRWTCGAPRA